MLIEQALLLAGSVFFCAFILSIIIHLDRVGRYPAFAGCLAALLTLAAQGYETSRLPWSALPETSALLGLIIGLAAAFAYRRGQPRIFCLTLAFLTMLLLLFAGLSWTQVVSLPEALRSPWLIIHVPVVLGAYAAFSVSAAASGALIYLKVARRGDEKSQERLDRLASSAISIGIVLLVAGIIIGALWAKSAWGTYWSWDPKETWSLITAIIYSLNVVLRYKGVKGEDAAYLSLLGFASVLFTYLGVSYIIPGLHSYA